MERVQMPDSKWGILTLKKKKKKIVYLKFKFNWTSCILFAKSGNSSLGGHLDLIPKSWGPLAAW